MGFATSTITVMYGNGSGSAGYSVIPTQAALLARVKNEYQTPFDTMTAAAGWTVHTPASASKINWDTATYDPNAAAITITPGSITVIGREWFKFDDAAQTTYPIFLTITYRIARLITTGNSVYALMPQYTWSTLVNADGTPAGLQQTATYIGNGTASGTTWQSSGMVDTPSAWYAAKQAGMLALKMAEVPSSSQFGCYAGTMVMERFRDLLGADASDDRGVVIIGRMYNSSTSPNTYNGILSGESSQNAVVTTAGIFPVPGRFTSGASGLDIPVFAAIHGTPTMRSSRNILSGFSVDWPTGAESVLPVPGGGTANFKSFGPNGIQTDFVPSANARLLVRWEA